tara:strand:+ start:4906 stop:5031 length:126 start_codon:yes stop_codon:yes gene_type:complete
MFLENSIFLLIVLDIFLVIFFVLGLISEAVLWIASKRKANT